MQLTTKFNLNDRVYYMTNNQVETSTITQISIEVVPITSLNTTAEKVVISYKLQSLGKGKLTNYLFSSKEELLASL